MGIAFNCPAISGYLVVEALVVSFFPLNCIHIFLTLSQKVLQSQRSHQRVKKALGMQNGRIPDISNLN